ncbi:HAD family hydrolase [Flavobacteriaceae bacterium F08102]|nr:HAD family hydrolase [Flavobacteriaceae bacterium F08102]
MHIKLICSDIDGTLLNKDRALSDRTIKAIQTTNLPFILISSRMPKAMTHLQKAIGNEDAPLIAYNGGLLLHKDEVLSSTEITHEVSFTIADFCTQAKLHMSLYHHDEWYVPSMDYWAEREANNTKVQPLVQGLSKTLNQWKIDQKGAHKIMLMGDETAIDEVEILLKNNYSDQVIGYRSKPTYLEIAHRNISKKTAIESLLAAKYPEHNFENVLAFGDNYNDIEMLKAVGLGVAVKNAKAEVIAIANETTEANIDDGVAVFLEGLNGN